MISVLVLPDSESVSRSGSRTHALSFSTVVGLHPVGEDCSASEGGTRMYVVSQTRSFYRTTEHSVQCSYTWDQACSIPAREGVPLNPMDYLL